MKRERWRDGALDHLEWTANEIERHLRQPLINARGSADHRRQVSNLHVFSQIIMGHVERFLSEASHCAATRASFPTGLRCQPICRVELFASLPVGAESCDELAKGLYTQFMESGDMALLDEALELDSEAIASPT
jgi:hypothetical protein